MSERESSWVIKDIEDGKYAGLRNEHRGLPEPGDDDDENAQLLLSSSRGDSSSTSTQGVGFGVDLNLGSGEEPSSSSAEAAVDKDAIDRGLHCKRPKVHSLSLEWGIPFVSLPAQEGNPFSLIEEEYLRMLNRVSQHLPTGSKGEESDHPVDPTSWGPDEDEDDFPGMDDLENRMDLTDDLLHMVLDVTSYLLLLNI